MLPTFIIAGAGKSGTTALWNYLKEHPEVCVAQIKEPMFFTRIKGQDRDSAADAPPVSGTFDKGFTWYKGLFVGSEGKKALGEASTIYMYAKDAPELIKTHVPRVKIIFVLRDPVDRAYSQYWQEKKAGWKLPRFEEMMQQRHPRFKNFVENSSYKKNLQRYLDIFPREQILILLSENLKKHAVQTLHKVYDFVSIQANFTPTNIGKRFNVAAMPRLATLQRLIRATSNYKLKGKVPFPLMEFLKTSKHYIVQWNLKPKDYEPLPAHIRGQLVNLFQEDIEFVESLLDVSLDHWKTTTVLPPD